MFNDGIETNLVKDPHRITFTVLGRLSGKVVKPLFLTLNSLNDFNGRIPSGNTPSVKLFPFKSSPSREREDRSGKVVKPQLLTFNFLRDVNERIPFGSSALQ